MFANRIPSVRLSSEDLKRLHTEFWQELRSDPEMENALRDEQARELAESGEAIPLHGTRNFSAISHRCVTRVSKRLPPWHKAIERQLDELWKQEKQLYASPRG